MMNYFSVILSSYLMVAGCIMPVDPGCKKKFEYTTYQTSFSINDRSTDPFIISSRVLAFDHEGLRNELGGCQMGKTGERDITEEGRAVEILECRTDGGSATHLTARSLPSGQSFSVPKPEPSEGLFLAGEIDEESSTKGLCGPLFAAAFKGADLPLPSARDNTPDGTVSWRYHEICAREFERKRLEGVLAFNAKCYDHNETEGQ